VKRAPQITPFSVQSWQVFCLLVFCLVDLLCLKGIVWFVVARLATCGGGVFICGVVFCVCAGLWCISVLCCWAILFQIDVVMLCLCVGNVRG